jgi:hypothetical protein
MSDPASRARQLMQEKENIEAEIVSRRELYVRAPRLEITADEASIMQHIGCIPITTRAGQHDSDILDQGNTGGS